MTVAELIDELKKYNPNLQVLATTLNDQTEVTDIWGDDEYLCLGEASAY